jgi:hypothetical protein
VEQDDAMEKSSAVNDENTYVSHYPDTRRYSMANAMATNRPQYRVDNQGYSVNTTQEADDGNEVGQRETKISMPPMYSQALADKFGADKKVKVRRMNEQFVFYYGKVGGKVSHQSDGRRGGAMDDKVSRKCMKKNY